MTDPILKDEGNALHFEIRTSVQRIMADYDKVFEARYQALIEELAQLMATQEQSSKDFATLRELVAALQLEQAVIARVEERQDRLEKHLTSLFDLVGAAIEELKARTAGRV